jgi:hypothetical protein
MSELGAPPSNLTTGEELRPLDYIVFKDDIIKDKSDKYDYEFLFHRKNRGNAFAVSWRVECGCACGCPETYETNVDYSMISPAEGLRHFQQECRDKGWDLSYYAPLFVCPECKVHERSLEENKE